MGDQDIRIGDAEREDALRLLGEHLAEGRLAVDEYGDRSARVTTARTRGELLALFADLPAPRPVFGAVPPLRQPAVRPGRFQLEPRVAAAIVPVVGLLCVIAFFAFRTPLVFLLVPAAALLIGRWGNRR
ncbi:DUF1707 SHOCT-like domain-containing protein [Saccharothrix obliqua]|uniref:DUF1707 SHOCT-like domain-containing protein n=1 Tax=Saccharothrix obliqua TaxID=2861747 RepID=UPI001C5DB23B|nr:DUF1707 domain-containing protein [Saccharothrix obliqua]MBW4716181.1 DUF1707 domain-containing protein [Saccharothrix obliqua]